MSGARYIVCKWQSDIKVITGKLKLAVLRAPYIYQLLLSYHARDYQKPNTGPTASAESYMNNILTKKL